MESSSLERRFQEWLTLVPVPRSLHALLAGANLDERLRQAGWRWDPPAYTAARYVLALLGGAAGVAIVTATGSGPLDYFLALTAILIPPFLPPLALALAVERRRTDIDRALPDLLDRLALGLEAGLGFEVALRRVATATRGVLGEELRRAIQALDRGHSKGESIARLASQNPSGDLRAFAASVRQAEQLGTSLVETFQVQAKLLRSRRRRKAQEAGRRLPILIVFPLVFFFLPALLIVYLAPPILHLFLSR